MTLSIDTITAFIAVDDDGEGIMAFMGPQGWMPMVAADQARVDILRPMAHEAATAAGKRCVVAQFSARKDIEVIEPGVPDPDYNTIIVDEKGKPVD